MKVIEFSDVDGQKIVVQHSSLATQDAYRIYVSGEDIIEQEDKLGNKIPVCLHINRNQAEILINALKDLIEDSE
jgi:hypothetical protein